MKQAARRGPKAPQDPSAGRPDGQVEGFLRPETIVLSDKDLVPDRNVIMPAPNRFTHELKRAQPYFYAEKQAGRPPDGEFAAGTKVALLVYDGGTRCRVADGRGLYVETAYDGLRVLGEAATTPS